MACVVDTGMPKCVAVSTKDPEEKTEHTMPSCAPMKTPTN